MRVATWNVNSVTARLPRLREWLDRGTAGCGVPAGDQVAEGGVPDRRGRRPGYEVAAGAKVGGTGWRSSPGSVWPTSRAASPASPAGRVSPSGRARALGSRRSRRRGRSAPPVARYGSGRCTCRTGGPGQPALRVQAGLARGAARRAGGRVRGGAAGGCGDFNVAPTDADVWDPEVFIGSTHVTAARTARAGRAGGAGADGHLRRR